MSYNYIDPKNLYIAQLKNSQITGAQLAASNITSGSFVTSAKTDALYNQSIIDNEELRELRDDQKMLFALMDAGVDQWEGYDEALINYRESRDG